MRYRPTLAEFKEKAKRGNLIPVYTEILADLDTPVSAFLKIREGNFCYLLESVEGGEKIAQYSFLGANPSLIFRTKSGRGGVTRGDTVEDEFDCNDPLVALKNLMARYRLVPEPELPRFHGGAVGYVAYDAVKFFEELPDLKGDDLGLPDSYFMVTDTILIFDHINHTIKVVSNAHVEDDVEAAYETAIQKIDSTIESLGRPLAVPAGNASDASNVYTASLVSNQTEQEYTEAVRKAKEYIRAGDIFQVVLSQRFQTEIQVAPFDVYRALRSVNPSPYMFYLELGNLHLVGSSPELMVRVEDRTVQVRPIAGTRRRGKDSEEDKALEQELLSDEKELAEHIMLVDLGRNDVGRVSESGTVQVTELEVIERYSHVMHIVSNVRGTLRPEEDCYSALRAVFPMGTVSGAPKIRAMEIIEELEPVKRGPYGGTLGYVSFSGNLDSCILIRTLIILDDTAYLQAGAGIVADSDPRREFEETINKAKALVRAIEIAERGLVIV
jgi:anthranilate synthase component 1